MKLEILITAFLLSGTMQLVPQPSQAQVPQAAPTPQTSQADPAHLNFQLQQAVCNQNWRQAINIVDRMIVFVSRPPGDSYTYKPQLVEYRAQLANLLKSNARIPMEDLPACAGLGS